MEANEIKNIVDAGFKDLEGKVDTKFQTQFEASKADIVKEIEEKGYKSEEEINTLISAKTADLEAAVIDLKKKNIEFKGKDKKSFSQYLGEALKEKESDLAQMTSKKGIETRMELKADEDIDLVNFAGDSYPNATTEFRQGLIQSPFAPIWLRNLIPNVTTTKGVINYPRFVGANGAAGVWDGSGDIEALEAKPGVSPTFEDVTENVIWIAGITRVKREMLDDVAYLRSFLPQFLTTGPYGLFVAENTYLYNAIDTDSVPYDGTNTIPVEMVYDAGFGQLRGNYLNPNLILMNNRDVVNLIALNKASGSGEYDLPSGSVAVIGNQLVLGGVPVVGVPEVEAGAAYVMDTTQMQFVSRMSPEVRAFEQDRDNVIKNLITFRAEERIAFVNFNANAIVKVEFGGTT